MRKLKLKQITQHDKIAGKGRSQFVRPCTLNLECTVPIIQNEEDAISNINIYDQTCIIIAYILEESHRINPNISA